MAGPEDGTPLLLIHGNVSSGAFFDELMTGLPDGFRVLAPDLRGFGQSETKPVDATRGLRDFSDDLFALMVALGLDQTPIHILGWSVGGGVAMQYALDHPAQVASLILQAPVSPYGFGGTRDAAGTPTYADFAASGGGTANPEFVQRLGAKDTSDESDFSPRKVMNGFYFKPPFQVEPEREDRYVAAMNTTVTGPGNYPGDMTPSPNWPTVAPGKTGMNNAISPQYLNLSGFADVHPKPPVLWVRGDSDLIVSDTSLFDFGFLGMLGAVPGWPGVEEFPPQPMIGQTRAVLDAYAAQGGSVREIVYENCGHSPHIEHPQRFLTDLLGFIQEV
jgi:pimeloyl-ACP methyl ester carboxylesterase